VSYLERLRQLETRSPGTDKTDKTNLVSFVSPPQEHIERVLTTCPAENDGKASHPGDPPLPDITHASVTGSIESDASLDPAAEARRQKVLAMLRENPGITYALVTDIESDPHAVIVALAIRGRAACELLIPRDRYDGVLLLNLIERHGMTIH
jgi:hypothetical protein